MLTTEELLNGLSPELTLRFFATFARLEFAMKHTGCLRHDEEGDVAEADRHVLVDRLSPAFFETVQAKGIAQTLIQQPAKNLYVQAQGAPDFGNALPPLVSKRQLLDAVWRVRNNLFHGNKLHPFNRPRDEALMNDVLSVIEAILDDYDDLRFAFNEPQQFF